MAGQYDIVNTVGGDFTPISQQYANFARSLPPIKARIDVTGLGTISRQASDFEKSLGAAQSRVTAFGLAAGSVYAVARAFEELVKSTVDVQKDLASINVVLGLSSNGLAKFSTSLFSVANLTAQSFKAVADVALQFSRQGLGAEEVLKRTADAMTLVRIGGTDTETAVKALTATLNTFNEVGLDSTAILNKIATVDTKFAVSGNVIAEALTRVSSTAKEAGVSFDSLIGITTALQQITSRGGSVIGNSLKSIFQRIQRPEVIEQLNEMGIATEGLNGKLLGSDVILRNVAKSYSTLSQAQQAQITQISAGLFQANQFKAIIGDLAKTNGIAARATDTASQSTDQATRRQAALNQTLASQLQVSLNNLTQFAAKAGEISIAPALSNIFKGINLVTDSGEGNGIGEKLGEGVLKGLGNFISGPGLATAGVLAAKFFGQFSTYAAKSLSQILETSFTRYEQEKAINSLLEKQPQIMQEIAALGNDEAAAQAVVLKYLNQQNVALNEKAQISKLIAASTTGLSPNTFFPTGGKSFAVSESSDGPQITKNPKFAGSFSAISASLSEAIEREKAMGVNPSSIKIGTSGLLVSADNPLGMAVYNTRDEPLGLEQGIQRNVRAGLDPKRAGVVPNFASSYYQNIPETIKDPFGRPPGDSLMSVSESVELENEINKLKNQIKIGTRSQESLANAAETLKTKFNLTSDSAESVARRLQSSFNIYSARAQKFTSSLSGLSGESGGQLGFNLSNPSSQGEFISIGQQVSADNEKRALNNKAKGYYGQFSQVGGFATGRQSFSPNLDILKSSEDYFAIKEREISSFSKNLNSLNLGSYFASVLPNSKFRQTQEQSELLGQQGAFKGAQDRLVSQALISSFIAPLVAGQIQNLIPNTSTTSRGIGAGVGALGNIASYAAIGGTVAPGPAGLLGGAAIGASLEIPSVIKAFTDKGPDLQASLEKLSESATKTSDALSGFVDTYQRLGDINSGNEGATVGQKALLESKNAQFVAKIPSATRAKILGAKNVSDIYDVASLAGTVNSQSKDNISDITSLNKSPSELGVFNKIGAYFKTAYDFGGGGLGGVLSTTLAANPFTAPVFAANGGLLSATQSNINQQNKEITTGNIQDVAKPLLASVLSSVGANSGKTLLSSITPYDLKTLQAGVNTGNIGSFNQAFGSVLHKNGFSSDQSNILTDSFSKLDPDKIKVLFGAISEIFNEKYINSALASGEKLNNLTKNKIGKENDLNIKLANLTVTGAESINAFEINVINKLSQSLTKLKIQGISDETSAKISALSGGQNDYSNARLTYGSEVSSANMSAEKESNKATAEFSTQVGNEFTSIVDNFTKGLINSKNKGADVEKLAGQKVEDFNKTLSGVFNISSEGGTYSGNLSPNVTSDTVAKAQSSIQNRIGELQSQLNTKNAPAQDIKESIATYQSILEQLANNSAALKKSLADVSANLKANLDIASAKLESNFQYLDAETLNSIQVSQRTSWVGRQFSGRAFNLGESRDISGRETSVALTEQIGALPQQKQVIDKLNQTIGSNYGINAIDNRQILTDALGKAKTPEEISALAIAITELGNISQETEQKIQQGIEKISSFSDDLSKSVENQNIQIAKNGNIGGGNYAAAFLAPLQYNNNDFQKDTVTATQQFAQELKSDLSDSLLSITKNAKSASEAFRDLGLALAESLAKKATDIGISQLFGLVTSGAGSIFSGYKSGGGYIPKFASGGMVNMGSGMADDVPAFLSGGEFVINKNAVKRIGKNNLDLLNQTPRFASGGAFIQPLNYSQSSLAHPNDSAGVASDSITGSSSAANVSLSNAYLFNPGLFTGKSVVSPLLSGIGASSALDPQNKLRLSREKYAFNTRLSYFDFQSQLDQYNTQQEMALGQAYIGAAGSVAGAFAGSGGGDSSAQMNEFNSGMGPVSSSSADANYQSLMNIQTGKLYSGGGSIPRFASGGYFGGDSGSDSFKAMVMGGEYVMNPKSVSKYGTNFFKSLNDTAKYAGGGAVGQSMYNNSGDGSDRIVDALSQIRDRLSSSSGSSNVSTAGSSAQTNHVTINVSMAANGSTSSQSSSSSVGSDSKDKSTQSQSADAMNKLAGNIKGLIVKEITQQSRPGGILHQAFVKKPN